MIHIMTNRWTTKENLSSMKSKCAQLGLERYELNKLDWFIYYLLFLYFLRVQNIDYRVFKLDCVFLGP